ncbi:hypothetical protein JZ751_007338, partial [Albula glossodonta]
MKTKGRKRQNSADNLTVRNQSGSSLDGSLTGHRGPRLGLWVGGLLTVLLGLGAPGSGCGWGPPHCPAGLRGPRFRLWGPQARAVGGGLLTVLQGIGPQARAVGGGLLTVPLPLDAGDAECGTAGWIFPGVSRGVNAERCLDQ